MTKDKTHSRLALTLDLVILDSTFEGQLNNLLLDCQSRELSPATLFYYQRALGMFIHFCHGLNLAGPGQVTSAHIRLFMVKLQATNKAISVGHYYRAIKRYFNFLEEEGKIAHGKNPTEHIHCPKVTNKIIQPFTDSDIHDMLVVCDDSTFTGARDKAIVLLFLDTGLRRSEMANIQLKDVNIKTLTIKVLGKGAKERVVKFGEKTLRALLWYSKLRGDKFAKGIPDLWLTEHGEALGLWGLVSIIRRVTGRAEIKDKQHSPHVFRHTFGTTSFKNGAKDWEVQTLLGHSTMTTTMLYRKTVNSADAVKVHVSGVDRMEI